MVSRVGMGGIPIQRPPLDEAAKIVEKAIDLGINFFDTSIGYHDSELRIGKGVEGHRDDVILATKGSWRDKETAADCIDRSLERLGTDYIDLWQFHNPGSHEAYDGLFKPGGAYEAAHEALEEGKILHVGVSPGALTPGEVVGMCRELSEMGFNYVVFNMPNDHEITSIEVIGEEVIPEIMGHVRPGE